MYLWETLTQHTVYQWDKQVVGHDPLFVNLVAALQETKSWLTPKTREFFFEAKKLKNQESVPILLDKEFISLP